MNKKIIETKKVVFTAPKKVGVLTETLKPLEDGEFLVKTLYSGISAGTELTFFNGTNPKSSEGWDATDRLFRGDLEPSQDDIYPKLAGYMNTAVVIESKNPQVSVGTNIAGMYGHVDYHVVTPSEFWTVLPVELDPIYGIWVAHMGPISMNGILYAADEVHRTPVKQLYGSLKGQRVIIFGAGMVGLLCGVFAKWAGAEVAITDGISERLQTAESLGLTPFQSHEGLAIEIKKYWHAEDSLNTGADIAIQCTGSDYLLNQAFSCLREQGTVIDLGFYQQGAHEVMFGKEFHHNRLRHICAQIGAIPRHQQSLWSKKRLAEETIAFLHQHGEEMRKQLITNEVEFKEGQKIFEKLSARDPALLQVVLHPNNSK